MFYLWGHQITRTEFSFIVSVCHSETSLERQEHFSQFQDTTDALPCHPIFLRCNHKIQHISYKNHVTNEEVRAKVQLATGPQEDLLTIVKGHKQQWYGHISHSSDLAKTILQGTVKRGRRQDRQKKRWEDNIREWTGLKFTKSQRAVENREKKEETGYEIICGAPMPSQLEERWKEVTVNTSEKWHHYFSHVKLAHLCMVQLYSCIIIPVNPKKKPKKKTIEKSAHFLHIYSFYFLSCTFWNILL